MSNKTFSEMDKHYDRHNQGICAVCGCTTERWKLVCDSCRDEAVQGLVKKEEIRVQEEEGDTNGGCFDEEQG